VRLLFDTNVLLDAVLVREPWADDAMAVLEAVEAGRAVGYVAPHGISTFYYFVAKHRAAPLALDAVREVVELCDTAPLGREDLRAAATLGVRDYEDAMHAVAARNVHADYVVTRDLKDFAASPVPAISPADVLRLL
jgi:predicted nucleic acid-binding protein